MATDAVLPVEFAELSGRVSYIQKKTNSEYSSTCPHCGGQIHPDGEFPDRFIMLTNSKMGKPFAFCRMCGYKWWKGRVGEDNHLDPATLRELERQAQEYKRKIEVTRQAKLKQFSTTELWDELHRRMQDEQRQWWNKQGISQSWQDYLKLGFEPDKVYKYNRELYHSPAYTIPYFHTNWSFITMQYRLTDPINPSEKYRFEQGLGTSYYDTTPSVRVKNKVIICEGAKKAIVTRIYGADENTTVYGVPSKCDWENTGVLDQLTKCSKVWIIFDPDCWNQPSNSNSNWIPQPIRMVRKIGDKARVVELSEKIDDAFVLYGMSKEEFSNVLKYS